MIEYGLIAYILFIHWLADFVGQSSWMAENKSTDNEALVAHTAFYTYIWALPALCLFSLPNWGYFLLTTFFTHAAIDYITSRFSKRFFSKGDYHNGFVVVGIDQVLHYLQSFGCYILLR